MAREPRQRGSVKAAIALWWLLAATTSLATAQERRRPWTRERHEPPPGTPPLHQLAFEHSPRIGGAAFSPDGTSLYLQTYPEVVNLWEVLVHHWPELLGGLSVLIVLTTALLVARVLRRPQRRGEPHCRRCNYNLSGLPPAPPDLPGEARTCPECGTDPRRRRPRAGRSTRRRLAPVVAPAVVALAAYGAMWAAGLPRQGRASVWFIWPSEWATEQIKQRQTARLLPFVSRHERIVVIDPATGKLVRTLARRATPTGFPLALSTDGEWLLLSGGPGTLERVSTRNGAVRGSVPVGGRDSSRRMGGRDIVGFSPDGKHAYVVYADDDAVKTRVEQWDLDTDKLTPVFTTDAYAAEQSPRRWVVPRRVAMISGDPPCFVVAPSFKEAFDTSRYILWMHAPGAAGDVHEVPVGGEMLSVSAPHVTADGRRIYVSQALDGILELDSSTLESLSVFRPDFLRDAGGEELCLDPTGDLLFFPVLKNSVLVRNIPQRRWIARFSTEGLIGPRLSVSPDGRWLSLVGFQGGGPQGGPYLHEVLIYDISGLSAAFRPPAPDLPETP